MSSNIKVVCRFRPLNAMERREGSDICVQIADGQTVKLKSQAKAVGAEAEGFTFDKAFPMDTQQVEVFQFGVKEIVDGQCERAPVMRAYLDSFRRDQWLQWSGYHLRESAIR
jgi:hypothetical protein